MISSRLIVTAKNNQFPRLVVCAACCGDGHLYGYPINPSERPYRIVCTECSGQGAIEKKVQ